MPSFDIMVEGKTYRVEIPDPGGCPLRVIVDGQAFDVAVAGTELSARPIEGPAAPPPVATQPMPLPAPQPAAAAPRAHAANGNGSQVLAPMPGTVLSVDVRPGQEVAAGTVLCVLEAMKMKNPIRASLAGRVAEIVVSPGQAVGYGELLMRLELPA